MRRRRLRRIGIYEAARAPLKPRHLRQTWNDLDMPVIVVVCWHVKGLSVKKVVIRHLSHRTLDTTDQLPRHPRKFAKLTRLYIFKSRLMPPRCKANLVAKPARIGAERHEMLGFGDNPLTRRQFLVERI